MEKLSKKMKNEIADKQEAEKPFELTQTMLTGLIKKGVRAELTNERNIMTNIQSRMASVSAALAQVQMQTTVLTEVAFALRAKRNGSSRRKDIMSAEGAYLSTLAKAIDVESPEWWERMNKASLGVVLRETEKLYEQYSKDEGAGIAEWSKLHREADQAQAVGRA